MNCSEPKEPCLLACPPVSKGSHRALLLNVQVSGQATLVSPGNLLEMQHLSLFLRPTEPVYTFYCDTQVIHVHLKILTTLP